MTTKEFNKGRSSKWIKQFNLDKSRIFLIVGIKENGNYTFVVDESQSVEKVVETLELLAKLVRKHPSVIKI